MVKYKLQDLNKLFVPDQNGYVLIVGDIILDRYVYGETARISPEAPVPVVRVNHTEDRPGGAGNVALNISGLGIHCTLIGITGDDPTADDLEETLFSNNIECMFIRQPDYPTITKVRVLSQHQQLIRLDYEAPAAVADSDKLVKLFKDAINNTTIVVLSDYAKGSLVNIEKFISIARKANKQVLVDPKGDQFDRYKNANLLTPNFKEFEMIVGVCDDQNKVIERGNNLCKSLSLDALLVTQGENGMTLLRKDDKPLHLTTDALEVYDVTGAGDTVIATIASSLASGFNLGQAVMFANKAAGLVVSKLGASTVSVGELNRAMLSLHLDNSGIVTPEQLKLLIDNIKEENKTIVITNGCFDILHAGHLYFLQQASKLGDYLIVAVNSDESVKRLKGKNRPINTLEDRMAILASLNMVDWVVSFDEDTPENLICDLKPDFLVKGGDYQPDEIAGSECVKNNNGQVIIIDLYQDYSSSNIVNSLKNMD